MSWGLSIFSQKAACKDDINVDLILLDDDVLEDQYCCRTVIDKLNKLVTSVAVPFFITVRSIADYVTRRSPEIATTQISKSKFHFSCNPKVMKKMLERHRNDEGKTGIFCHSRIASVILSVGNQILFNKDPKIQYNDNILTCGVSGFSFKLREKMIPYFFH